jgi:phosphomannomutase
MFDPALFDRKADIRGLYPNQINEELAWCTGRYLVRSLREILSGPPRVLLGRDGRVSSPAIYAALAQGIASEGGVPIPAGLATTDMIQWGVGLELDGAQAGVMVTASHNPAEYNGIKTVVKNPSTGGLDIVRPLDHLAPRYAEELRSGNPVTETIQAAAPFPASAGLQLQERFVEAALSRSDRLGSATGKIVLDPGNGVGGIFRPLLQKGLRERGAKVELLAVAERIDGTFPTRPSNPGLPGAVRLLQETVIAEGAAFGAAFDGDADRVFLVDEWGQFVSGSVLLAALAKSLVEKNGGGPVVYSAVSSWLVPETVRATATGGSQQTPQGGGGRPILCRVGQDAAKVALTRTQAVFGGESSAHYNFPDTFCLDSGLFALITFWDMLLESGKSCSQLLGELKPWPNSGEVNLRVECSDWKAMSGEVIAALKAESADPSSNCYVLDIDGVSVCSPKVPEYPTADDLFRIDPEGDPTGETYREVQDYTPEWWFNVRASNNEPLLRVNFESRDSADVAGRTYSLISRIRAICGDRARVVVQDWGNLK